MITDFNLQKIILPIFDLELQRVVQNISYFNIQKQLNISTIFFDSIIISPSFVLESKITENIVKNNQQLVNSGILNITIRENTLSLFLDKKVNLYRRFKPFYERIFLDWSNWPILFNAKVIQRQKEIGKALDAQWLIELASENVFSLKNRIIHLFENDNKNISFDIIGILKKIPETREDKPFVWELIKDHLQYSKIGINVDQILKLEFILRSHLLGLYFDTLADGVGAKVSSFCSVGLLPINHLIDKRIIRLNFIEIIFKALNIYEKILSFNDEQIIAAKSNLEYRAFRETCLTIIDEINNEDDLFERVQQQYLYEHKYLMSSCRDLIVKYKDKRFRIFINSIFQALEGEKGLSSLVNNPFLVDVIENVPLFRFSEKIIEIYKERCNGHLQKFEYDLVNLIKKHDKEIKVSNYNFNNPNFTNSTIGDSGIVNNYYVDNKSYVDNELSKLVDAVLEADLAISDKISIMVEELKNMLASNHQSGAQKIWEEIKEGVKTSSAITSITIGVSKLLGM